MQQLSGLDAAFLALDTETVFAHVGSVCVLAGPLTADRLRLLVAARLDDVPLFRRRLVGVPGGVDHPYWVEGHVDLQHHIQTLPLPKGRESAQRRLAELVSFVHSRPLDRSRPLWEMWLITGMPRGRVALYSKVHHAAMDGIAGGDALMALVDRPGRSGSSEAGGRGDGVDETGAVDGAGGAQPEEVVPGGPALLALAAVNLSRYPGEAARVAGGVVAALPAVASTLRPLFADVGTAGVREWLRAPKLWAPATPFNAPLTARRRWASAALSMADLKTVRRGTDLTVNDVLVALAAGALRRWLRAHDSLPDSSLVAAIPVSVRARDQGGTYGNRVSLMLAALPTTVVAPAARLAATQEALRRAKAGHAAVPAGLLADLTQLTPPVVAGAAWHLLVRARALQWGVFNLVVSTIPGPRQPLRLAGSELLAWYPVSAIADGQGLNITVTTYRGVAHFGLVADPELVPDLESMAGYLGAELRSLVEAVTAAS